MSLNIWRGLPLLRWLAIAYGLFALVPAIASESLPLAWVRDIPLPGSSTRMDYQSLDPQSGMLFIAHLGGSEVIAFDTRKQRVAGTIANISQVHGVLAVPALDRLYASATGTNEIAVIEESTLKLLARTPAGRYPDGLSYSPVRHALYVSDEFGHTLASIDAHDHQLLGKLDLGGEVGNNQYDPLTQHVFANVQTLRQLVEIDPAAKRIVHRYPLSHCASNHGLLLDQEQRWAFIACEDNARLLVWDMRQHKIIGEHEVGGAPDVLAYDAGLHCLYVASEAGVVSVFQVSAAGLAKKGEAYLAPKAHSIAVDPQTHLVYLPLENIAGHPVLRIMRPL